MNNNRKKTISTILIIIGIILVIGSIIFYIFTQNRMNKRKKEILDRKKAFQEKILKNKNNSSNNLPKSKHLKKSEVDLKSNEKTEKKEKQPTHYDDEIAFLEIKKLGVTLPVFNGTSEYNLKRGTGLLKHSDMFNTENNSLNVIAGHRGGYNGEDTFLNVHKLNNGDTIELTTFIGKLIYEVIDKKIVKSTDWSQFYREKDKNKLILLTCHPYPKNTERLLIITKLKR